MHREATGTRRPIPCGDLTSAVYASGWCKAQVGTIGADPEMSPRTLFDELASLDLKARQEVATILRQVSETFEEVPDGGGHTAHTLRLLAHWLDSG